MGLNFIGYLIIQYDTHNIHLHQPIFKSLESRGILVQNISSKINYVKSLLWIVNTSNENMPNITQNTNKKG